MWLAFRQPKLRCFEIILVIIVECCCRCCLFVLWSTYSSSVSKLLRNLKTSRRANSFLTIFLPKFLKFPEDYLSMSVEFWLSSLHVSFATTRGKMRKKLTTTWNRWFDTCSAFYLVWSLKDSLVNGFKRDSHVNECFRLWWWWYN